MLQVSQLYRMHVYRPKKKATGDPTKMDARDLTLVGRIHLTVFSPKGDHVVGFMVKKPDVASMIKVEDAFLAYDAFAPCDLGLVAIKGDQSWDGAARERLGLAWDKCLIWTGMDARTTDGKEIGWVNNAEFHPKSGKVTKFYVGDGAFSEKLVGDVEVPIELLRGYSKGKMLLAPEAAQLALNGGFAARAGESYAKAKHDGKVAGQKAAQAAGEAVEKGAFTFGKMFGDTAKAFKAASGSPKPKAVKAPQEKAQPAIEVTSKVEDVPAPKAVTGKTEVPDEKPVREFVPVSEAPKKTAAQTVKKSATKPTTTKKKSTSGSGDQVAKAVGRQLKKSHGMFGAFMAEYKKASK